MQVTQQDVTLPVDVESEKKRKKHSKLLSDYFRATFFSSSRCKRNALLSLLSNENGLCFQNVYSKSLYQPNYQLLQDVLETVKGM